MGKFNLKHKISIKRKKGILYGDIYNDYDRSVYIKGDFTASLAEAQSLAQEYGRDDFYVVSPNDDYGFFTNNCGYVTTDLFLMGTLPDGTLVKDYVDIKAAEEKKLRSWVNNSFVGSFLDKTCGLSFDLDYYNSFVPNINMNKMQEYFGNTGFSENDFWAGLSVDDRKHFVCQ